MATLPLCSPGSARGVASLPQVPAAGFPKHLDRPRAPSHPTPHISARRNSAEASPSPCCTPREPSRPFKRSGCAFAAFSLPFPYFFFPHFASKLPPNQIPLAQLSHRLLFPDRMGQQQTGEGEFWFRPFSSRCKYPGVPPPVSRPPNGAFLLQLAQAILGSLEVF